jgi:transcriptional accessory protein Tex/SPT6
MYIARFRKSDYRTQTVKEHTLNVANLCRKSAEKLRTPAQVVKVGEIKEAKVLGIDMKGKNLNLTLILDDKNEESTESITYKPEEANFTIGESIGDALEDLLK